jgi:hypothetical protein
MSGAKSEERTFARATEHLQQFPSMRGADNVIPAVAEAQREVMNFVAMRLEKDSDTARELAACANMADVAQIQFRWAQDLIRDYGTEMTKMVALYSPRRPGGTGAPKR